MLSSLRASVERSSVRQTVNLWFFDLLEVWKIRNLKKVVTIFIWSLKLWFQTLFDTTSQICFKFFCFLIMQYKSHHRFAKLTACQNFRHFGFQFLAINAGWKLKVKIPVIFVSQKPIIVKDEIAISKSSKIYLAKLKLNLPVITKENIYLK